MSASSQVKDEDLINEQLADLIEKAKAAPSAQTEWWLRSWCHGPSGAKTLELFGSGTAIWANRYQVKIPATERHTALQTLLDFDFPSMRASYGGKEDPADFVSRVLCQVDLRMGGQQKTVVQYEGGRQFAPFLEMADRLLSLGAATGSQGITADGLSDALEKLASGQLAPEVLEIVVNRQPDGEQESASSPGWRLTLKGGRLTLSDVPRSDESSDHVVQLAAAELQALAEQLAQADLEDLPENLFGEQYTDLFVEILSFKKGVQARRFSRMNPTTHGRAQQQFESLMNELSRLRKKAAQTRPEGTPQK